MNVFFRKWGRKASCSTPKEKRSCSTEDVNIEGTWYTVVERNWYLKHLDIIDDNSITL